MRTLDGKDETGRSGQGEMLTAIQEANADQPEPAGKALLNASASAAGLAN